MKKVLKVLSRILVVVLIVAVIASGLYFYSGYTSTQAAQTAFQSIQMAPLQKGELVVTIAATGKVRPQQTAQLAWGTSGQVDTVGVKVGDPAKTGQVLASLAETSLPQSVIAAQGNLVSDQQALDNLTTTATQTRIKALADITTYEVAVRDAQYNLDNFTVPSNQANLSTTDALAQAKKVLDAARTAFEPYKGASELNTTRKTLLDALNTAQADYNSAIKRMQLEYNLQVAQANLAQAWSDYNKYKDGPDPKDVAAAKAKIAADQATLEQLSIKAPFDGTITDVSSQAGDQVTNGTAAFRIDNMSALYVDLSVSEVDIHQVQAGQPVTVTFDALRNKTYKGQVTEVAPVSTDTGTAVNFTVTVRVTNPDNAVHPGMTAEVLIIVAQKPNVLLVPLQAVTTVNGRQIVYVYSGNRQGTPQPGGGFQRNGGTPQPGQNGSLQRPAGTPQPGQNGGGFQPNGTQTANGTPGASQRGSSQQSALFASGFRPVVVTLGLSAETYAELASGNLQPGEQIVLNPDRLLGTIQSTLNNRGGFGGIFGMFGGGPGGGFGGGGRPAGAGGNNGARPAGSNSGGGNSGGNNSGGGGARPAGGGG